MGAGLCDLGEQVGRAGREVDRRDQPPQPLEELLQVGDHVEVEGGGVQHARPAVEDLEHLGTGGGLGHQIAGQHLGQSRHKLGEEHGIAVYERPDVGEVAGAVPLHQVTGEREGGGSEADQGRLVTEFGSSQADGWEQVRGRLLGLEHPQLPHLGGGPDRVLHHRPDRLLDLEWDPHPFQRQHDVGEEHGRVHPQQSDRHAGDLRRQLGIAHELHEAQLLAQGPIAGQGPAGLAHEPDRGGVGGLVASGSEQAQGGGHRRLPPPL